MLLPPPLLVSAPTQPCSGSGFLLYLLTHQPLPSSASNTHIEEEINRLRAELLRKDQDADRMQLALAAEKEERERAQVGG